MSNDGFQRQLAEMRTREHGECVVCGLSNASSLRVEYQACEDGSISARLPCPSLLQGYRGQLHGGIISSLLDGAMTHCLFAGGREAVTAELKIRYRQPVNPTRSVVVRAWMERSRPPFAVLGAALAQDGQTMATACAKFIDRR